MQLLSGGWTRQVCVTLPSCTLERNARAETARQHHPCAYNARLTVEQANSAPDKPERAEFANEESGPAALDGVAFRRKRQARCNNRDEQQLRGELPSASHAAPIPQAGSK